LDSHGDLLFVSYTPLAAPLSSSAFAPAPAPPATSSTLSGKIVSSEPAPNAAPSTSVQRVAGKKPWEEVKEDDVDVYWGKKDGKIQRKKGTDLCKCGPKAMCDYCMPLEVRTRVWKKWVC
jgi:nuclear protein localization family protein 4